MNKYIYILFIGFLITMTSCRKDFETVPSSGCLEFSKKIVYLDTIFTNISSSTYTLKVYNRSNKDIHIPVLQLGKADSKYDNPYIWSHELAEAIAQGRATRADAEQHIRNLFDTPAVQNALRAVPASCEMLLR